MSKRTTSLTLIAAALGLVCTTAFAAGPPNHAQAQSTRAPARVSHANENIKIVSSERKVYYFNQLDRNHNGMLSRAELPHSLVNLRRDFARIDFNGNGQLSPEEILLWSHGLAPEYTSIFHGHVTVFSDGSPVAGNVIVSR